MAQDPSSDPRAHLQDSSLESSSSATKVVTPEYEKPHHGLLDFSQRRKLLVINIIILSVIAAVGAASYLLLGANNNQAKSKTPNYKVAKVPVNNVKTNNLL